MNLNIRLLRLSVKVKQRKQKKELVKVLKNLTV